MRQHSVCTTICYQFIGSLPLEAGERLMPNQMTALPMSPSSNSVASVRMRITSPRRLCTLYEFGLRVRFAVDGGKTRDVQHLDFQGRGDPFRGDARKLWVINTGEGHESMGSLCCILSAHLASFARLSSTGQPAEVRGLLIVPDCRLRRATFR